MRKKTTAIVLFISTFLIVTSLKAATQSISVRRLEADLLIIRTSHQAMQATIAFIDNHPEIFPPEKLSEGRLPDRNQRMVIWQCWQTFLDHLLFFDLTGQSYAAAYQDAKDSKDKVKFFYYGYASFLAQYRFALEFIERLQKNPAMDVILNEPVPELGLAGDAYKRLKFRFLNIIRTTEFARLNFLYKYYANDGNNPFPDIIKEDAAAIWEAGVRGTGPSLTLQNALKIVGDLGFTAWFPVQKKVSRQLGNIKVWRQDQFLIAPQQIKALQKKLRPGDILLERREWYASNLGIPGFWSHAALYIGTAEERNRYFSGDAVVAWLRAQGSQDGSLDSLLQKRNPDQYELSQDPQQENHLPRVLEAIGKGVSFTTLEHSAAADSLAVLRPNLPLQAKALAIIRAFHYSGRPYDFNFDFLTDSKLVCSELIYKAYEKTAANEGLILPLTDLLGRKMVSPNDIARLFAQEQTDLRQQFRLIAFLDGREWSRRAVKADLDAFVASWKRPKWHIWMQDTD